MQKFRQKKIQILVATDVAARGIDINDLTHVINYNLPDDNEIDAKDCKPQSDRYVWIWRGGTWHRTSINDTV